MAQTYDERRAERQDRLDARADRLAAERDAAYAKRKAISGGIPFGQPVLVGHHSEGRHRSDIRRMHSLMGKQVEAQRELEHVQSSGPTAAVLASDADAVEQLQARIAELEARHAAMIARNKIAAGAHPGWQLSNSSANLRRLRERAKHLEVAKAAESTEREVGGVRVVEDVEAQRIRLIFPSKPAPEVIAELKSSGFRWSPSESAWQRHLNNAGRYAVECVLRKLGAEP